MRPAPRAAAIGFHEYEQGSQSRPHDDGIRPLPWSNMTMPLPAPVAVPMGRSARSGFFGVLVFLTVIVGVSAVSSARADGSARILGFAIAVLFAIPLLIGIVRAPVFLAPRALVYDGYGMHLRMGGKQHSIAWSLIAAIAIGYEYRTPEREALPVTMDQAKEILANRATDAVMEAFQTSDKRRFWLEIYPSRPDAVQFVPGIRRTWMNVAPPSPALAPMAWRILLPPVTEIADNVGRAAHQWAPQRWFGFVARPWSGRS